MYLDLTYRSSIAQATGVGLGVGDLTIDSATSGEYAMLRGDHAAIATDAADAYHLHARTALRSLANVFFEVGFCDSDRTDYARIEFDTNDHATEVRLAVRDGSTENTATLASTFTADTFDDLTIMWAPGVWVGCWVNGDRSDPLTTNLPATSLTPYVLVGTRTSATKTVRIDRVHLRALSGVVENPATNELIAAR